MMNEIDVLRRVQDGQFSFDETDGDLNEILEALYDLHASGCLLDAPVPHLAFNSDKLAGITVEGGLTYAGTSLAETAAERAGWGHGA